MISAVILTKNEEKRIKQSLESLSWCGEIIVVDDYSNDKTKEICEKFGARVYQRALNGDFSGQRNFGLFKAKGDWILFVDADEVVSSQLRQEIESKTVNINGINGFFFKRIDYFFGRWLKHGETAFVRLLRLARRGSGQWRGKVHETWQIKGEVGCLDNPLIHKRNLTIDEFLIRINFYSSLRAKELYLQKVKTNWFYIVSYPLGKFIQNYFFRLGFLDGKEGLTMTVMMSFHSFLVRAKLFLLWKNKKEANG